MDDLQILTAQAKAFAELCRPQTTDGGSWLAGPFVKPDEKQIGIARKELEAAIWLIEDKYLEPNRTAQVEETLAAVYVASKARQAAGLPEFNFGRSGVQIEDMTGIHAAWDALEENSRRERE